ELAACAHGQKLNKENLLRVENFFMYRFYPSPGVVQPDFMPGTAPCQWAFSLGIREKQLFCSTSHAGNSYEIQVSRFSRSKRNFSRKECSIEFNGIEMVYWPGRDLRFARGPAISAIIRLYCSFNRVAMSTMI